MIHDYDQTGLNDDPSYHNIDRVQTTTQFNYYNIYTTYKLLTIFICVFSRL